MVVREIEAIDNKKTMTPWTPNQDHTRISKMWPPLTQKAKYLLLCALQRLRDDQKCIKINHVCRVDICQILARVVLTPCHHTDIGSNAEHSTVQWLLPILTSKRYVDALYTARKGVNSREEQEIWANAHGTRDSISLISYAGCLGLSPVYFSENSL